MKTFVIFRDETKRIKNFPILPIGSTILIEFKSTARIKFNILSYTYDDLCNILYINLN